MIYYSIDIETSGLDPLKDSILQIAIVKEDTSVEVPIDQLPYLNIFIAHERVSGDPFALQMNARILEIIAKKNAGNNIYSIEHADADLFDFAQINGLNAKITPAGKNFASFDRNFINNTFPRFASILHHRCLDPVNMYWKQSDSVLPNMDECLKRAGINSTVSHDALSDARQIVELIRKVNK